MINLLHIPDTLDNQPFWDAAKQNKLVIKQCQQCHEFFHYPRPLCPYCHSTSTEWVASSGSGRIYSFSTFRIIPEPFTLGYVTLEEGITIMTRLVDCDPDKLEINQRVVVVFPVNKDGIAIPCFKLI